MSAPSARRANATHTLNISGPLGIALAAVAVIAIALFAIIMGSPPGGATLPPGSAQPSTSGVSSPISTPSESATPAVPSTTATPISSASSSPTPAPDTWTTLTWSPPVTPAFTINLYDVRAWRDGYVAVGQVRSRDAAFLSSPDGLHWTVRHQVRLSEDQLVKHLVILGDRLLAFSSSTGSVPLIWQSTDGQQWTHLDSPAWAELWADHVFIDVASGPSGIVAIGDAIAGNHGELFADPIVVHSQDGVTWERTELEGAANVSVVRDVIAFGDRYAVLGGEEIGPVTGMGTPQAWWSTDGVRWIRGTVDGAKSTDNQFQTYSAVAARSGLVARTELLCAGCPPTNNTWVSRDGRVWERAADRDGEPPFGMMSGDGERIVVLATKAEWSPIGSSPEPYPGLTSAWMSTDGFRWLPLSLSHAMTDQVEGWWVVPDGVVFAGVQSFWFGSANHP